MKLVHKYKGTVVNNFIDPETGELLDTEVDVKTKTILVETKEQFAFTYSSIIGALKNLTGADIKLLTYICLKAEYNTNIVVLIKPFLLKLSEEVDLSVETLKASVTNLKRQGVIIPLGSGAYRINPRYYWRGDSTERKNKLKFVLEVECPTC